MNFKVRVNFANILPDYLCISDDLINFWGEFLKNKMAASAI